MCRVQPFLQRLDVCVCDIFRQRGPNAGTGRPSQRRHVAPSAERLSMQAGGGLFFYGTTLYMSLSQPRLLVSVSSTVQNKYKKQTVSAHSLKKENEKSKKESVPKRLNRCFPSLYSALFLPVHVLVTPVKQPSSRRPLRENGYIFGASQNLFGSKLSVCSSTL